ncbi:RHS repeat-associated core domain-containing protein [Aliiroseovarius crassostreae]|nr:RHS repeat-associated core domain-containing protein [Aliiroseovarius crassostreae]
MEFIRPPAHTAEAKGFIGERYDDDSGLQFLKTRYYDPKLAMFIQPDWFEVTQPGGGTNRYSYSFNDPINKMDPSGNEVYDDGKDKWGEGEKERMEKEFDATRKRLEGVRQTLVRLERKIRHNPKADIKPGKISNMRDAIMRALGDEEFSKAHVDSLIGDIDKVLDDIGVANKSGVTVFRGGANGEATAEAPVGGDSITIFDKFFTDGSGSTITHEMGHSSLGRSDFLPKGTSIAVQPGGSIQKRSSGSAAYVRGWNGIDAANASVPGFSAFHDLNDGFTCLTGSC